MATAGAAGDGDAGSAIYDSADGAGIYGEVLRGEVSEKIPISSTKQQRGSKHQEPSSREIPNSKFKGVGGA